MLDFPSKLAQFARALIAASELFENTLRSLLMAKNEHREIDRLVGENLRRFRVAAKVTLTAIADLLGISERDIRLIEAGQREMSATELNLAARKLSVPIDDFFASNPNAKPFPADGVLRG